MTAAVPQDDLVAHEPDDCVCGPLVIPVVTGTGVRADIEIHRRLDGRENPGGPEQGHGPPVY